jgi:hypothetical protein
MSTPGTLDNQPIATVLSTGGALDRITISPALWGFGGVHGGLTLALLTEAMRRRADGRALRSVFAQFRRPLREEVEIHVTEDGTWKTVSWLSAEAGSKRGVAVAARATFSRRAGSGFAPISPSMSSSPPSGGMSRVHAPRRLSSRSPTARRPVPWAPRVRSRVCVSRRSPRGCAWSMMTCRRTKCV